MKYRYWSIKACIAVLTLIAPSPSPTKAQVTVPQEVWIANRTDGQPGSGTITDPYDGSTQAKFDAIMADNTKTPANTYIHLGPGTFLTQISPANLWHPRSGWIIEGAGMYATTIQAAPTNSLTNVHYDVEVIKGIYNVATDNLILRNFTVDCNWAALASSADSGAGSYTVADGHITSGSPVLTSSTANGGLGFTVADFTRTVTGTGIPSGTTIASVEDSTHITMSASATTTDNAASITIGGEKHVALAPINLTGSYNLIENVRCIHQYGSVANGSETMGMSISSTPFADATGNIFRFCRVELPQGNYGSGFVMGGWVQGSTSTPDRYVTNSIVQNCVAIGVNNGLNNVGFSTGLGGFANAKNCEWVDNLAIDCNGGFYCDTGSLENIKIANNTVVRGSAGVALVTDHPEWHWTKKNIGIIGNNLNIQNRINGCCGANFGIWVTGAATSSDITISENYISFDPNGHGYKQFLTIDGYNLVNATIASNIADEVSAGNSLAAPLRGEITNSFNVTLCLNRTTCGRPMSGLPDNCVTVNPPIITPVTPCL